MAFESPGGKLHRVLILLPRDAGYAEPASLRSSVDRLGCQARRLYAVASWDKLEALASRPGVLAVIPDARLDLFVDRGVVGEAAVGGVLGLRGRGGLWGGWAAFPRDGVPH